MSFAAEDQLLIQCSRVKMSDEAIGIASNLLQQDLNWDYILEASILHSVAPLFHHGLTQLTRILDIAAVVPPAIREELQQLYLNNLARNRRLYSVIGDIFKAFQQANIKAMGLKDLPLARTVFPDMGLRPIGDVDILIHKEDYARVEKCMASLGFTPLPSPECPYLLKYAWALHFHRSTDNVWVDVQWGVLQLEWDIYGEGNFDFEINRMWRGARVMTIDDYEILEPKPEDMLFHLCMHLEGHRYTELILFCDIAELLRYYGDTLDWDYLIAITKKYRVEASIYYTLLITQRLLDCPLPVSLQELEPDYFKANLFGPLFGNLTTLHVTLDDSYRIASPPAEVMTQFETIVRRQTACAMRWYEELDRLAMALSELGTDIVIFDGDPSQMVFPSQALPPFPDIRLFTLDQDRSRLRQALSACGFERSPELVKERDQVGGVESYNKRRVFESKDPATGSAPLALEIRSQIIDNLGSLLCSNTQQESSKKNPALKALAGALGHDKNDPSAQAQLYLIVLSPEEMVLYLAARSGQRQHERLFGCCSLLELFRSCQCPINWQKVADIAEQYGLGHQVYAGLLMANALLNQPVSVNDLARFNCSDMPPRMLQWARYGPAELDRYTSFKGLFFRVFTFLSIKGLGAKLKYLGGSSSAPCGERRRTGGRGKTFLTSVGHAFHLGAELFANAFRGKNHYTARDFAYWTEPEPLAGDGTSHL